MMNVSPEVYFTDRLLPHKRIILFILGRDNITQIQ